jgi:mono/diheme cytochrome c family protein
MRKFSSGALVIALWVVNAAYAGNGAAAVQAEETASPSGNPQKGRELFESGLGCNICHGMDARGAIGPNIRQTTIDKVYHALQNFPDMMNWQYNNPELFEEQALLDIVSYLQTLERDSAE